MIILVVNTGSTSIKFQCVDTGSGVQLCRGHIGNISSAEAFIQYKTLGKPPLEERRPVADQQTALEILLRLITSDDIGIISSARKLDAIGHRVVHGGDAISSGVVVTPEIEELIESFSSLAPLHNSANLQGIRIMKKLLPSVKQVAVFDTAFHVTIPEEAYLYGLSYEYYAKHGIRRFGFHGPSHQYVFQRAATLLNIDPSRFNAITCHMGGGVSIAAIQGGVSVDTSLGFGTAAGIPMGTRAGDVDPSAILFLIEKLGMTTAEVQRLLYEESGLLGLSGVSGDIREILEAAAGGNSRANLALRVFVHASRKQIAGLAASLGGRLTAVIFTAGIGESSPPIRQMICSGLEVLGFRLDQEKNRGAVGREAIISRDDSQVHVLVVPTNEEAIIAEQTSKLISPG